MAKASAVHITEVEWSNPQEKEHDHLQQIVSERNRKQISCSVGRGPSDGLWQYVFSKFMRTFE